MRRLLVTVGWIAAGLATIAALSAIAVFDYRVARIALQPSSVDVPKPSPCTCSKNLDAGKSAPIREGQWVRHDDGELGLVEEVRPDGLYRVRITTDRDGEPAQWYEAKVWHPARPKAREWWCDTRTGILFQPSKDWTVEAESYHEPVNWDKG